jgi:hypothetical protein
LVCTGRDPKTFANSETRVIRNHTLIAGSLVAIGVYAFVFVRILESIS